MKKHRIASSFAAIVCVLALVAGMGVNAVAEPLTTEPVTLRWFFPTNAAWTTLVTDFNELTFFQEMERITGVHIEWMLAPVGQEKEQFNLMINSGDLPDLITHDSSLYTYPGGGDKAIEDGAYLRLNELIEQYAPNYSTLINSTDAFRSETKTDEGNIWAFSMVESERQGAWSGLVVRQDWLDQLGMETPVTYDDWHEMLTRFKNELGAETPLLLPANLIPADDSLIAGFGIGQRFYQVDGTVKYGPLEDAYRDFIATMRQWYEEGLIDPEFTTRESGDSQIYNNQAGVWYDGFYMLEARRKLADSDTFRAVGIATPVLNEGDTAHLRQSNNYVRGYETAIAYSCANPELAVRYLDYIYSDEGYMLSNYGIEGLTYTIDENGDVQWTDLIINNPDGLGINDAIHLYCLHHGPMNRVWSRDAAGYTEDENACTDIWGKADDSYVMPPVTLTADEGSRFSSLMTDIDVYVQEMTVKFVNGMEDMETYDAFVEQIKAMNIEEAIALQQAALDRFLARG